MRARGKAVVGVIVALVAVGMVQADQMDDAAVKAQLLAENPDRATGLGNLPMTKVVEVRQPSFGCDLTVDFDNGMPGDWTVVDNEGNGVTWGDLAHCGEAGNFTNGGGDVACVSSDVFGTADFDTELQTPSFSTTGMQTVTLDFTANYQNYANEDFLDVDVSVDGGSNWTNVLSWNEDHGSFRATPGEDVSLDISAEAAGQANVIIRWRYHDPAPDDYEWYAQIDNAALTCVIPVELQAFSVE